MKQEEKARAYDEALERAGGYHEDKNCFEYLKGVLENIFPELQESEDEKMRNIAINACKYMVDNFENSTKQYEDAIAWLEKQDDIKETINRDEFTQGILKGAAINLITWIDYNAAEGNMCLSNTECKDIEDALVSGNWNKIYAYMKKKLEKQGEQKHIFDFNANNWYVVSKVDGKIHNIYNSGVEPKFHKDEWVVNNATLNLCHILRVEHGQYICDDCSFPITKENEYHLWTIQDAKAGDVLVFKGIVKYSNGIKYKRICLFNNLDNAFFTLTKTSNNIEECNINVNIDYPDNIVPATKEQKEILFMTIKDAGYEFDFDKKELKMIAQKFNIGDEIKTANEEPLTITKIDEKGYWSNDLFICDFDESIAWDLVGKAIQKFNAGDWVVISTTKGDRVIQIASVECFTKDGYPSYITTEGSWFGNGTKARLLTDKDVEIATIPENKLIVNKNKIESWSKDDEELCQDALDAFEALANDLNPSEDWGKLYDWLNSIKQRMGGDDYERK